MKAETTSAETLSWSLCIYFPQDGLTASEEEQEQEQEQEATEEVTGSEEETELEVGIVVVGRNAADNGTVYGYCVFSRLCSRICFQQKKYIRQN